MAGRRQRRVGVWVQLCLWDYPFLIQARLWVGQVLLIRRWGIKGAGKERSHLQGMKRYLHRRLSRSRPSFLPLRAVPTRDERTSRCVPRRNPERGCLGLYPASFSAPKSSPHRLSLASIFRNTGGLKRPVRVLVYDPVVPFSATTARYRDG